MLEFRRTFCTAHGRPWERVSVSVRASRKGCDVTLFTIRRDETRSYRSRWRCFLAESDALRRVMAGVRMDERMPSWMLADVLRELGAPEFMCEIVMRSDLDELGSEGYEGAPMIVSRG